MKDFNNLPGWLNRKIPKGQKRIEKFAWKAKISRISMYYYLNGTFKPSTQTLAKICRALGVPLEEGLQQFSPSQMGRPRGGGGTREVTVRSR